MPTPNSVDPSIRRLARVVQGFALGWLVVIGFSLGWNITSWREQVLEIVRTEARANYKKDLLYRRWAAMHGGVYVPPTAETPPNPYLENLPERDVVTTGGKALTLINPAYMTRQVNELAQKQTGVHGHLTSLDPIRPENAPDSWERAALQAFERGAKEVTEVISTGGVEDLRLMRPMIVELSCLKCHEQQGYQVGDVRGGISMTVPMGPFLRAQRRYIVTIGFIHAILGGVGLVGLLVGHRRLRSSLRDRLAADAAARAAEQRWQIALESAGDGLWERNLVTGEAYFSSSWKTMLGYAADEVTGRVEEWKSRVHPDDLGATLAAVQRHLAEETPAYESEHRLRCKDGSYKWILDRGRVVSWSDDGRPAIMLGTHTDITARRTETERRRKDAEQYQLGVELYRQMPEMTEQDIFDHVIACAVSLTDSEIGFLHRVSEDQENITLTSWNQRAPARGPADFERLLPLGQAGDWADFVREHRPVIYNEGVPSTHQYGLPSGPNAILRFMSIPVIEDGKVRIIIGVGNKADAYGEDDVNRLQLVAVELQKYLARRRMEATLRLEHDRAEQYLEVAGCMLVGISMDGKINLLNRKGSEVLGYAPSELVGRDWFESCLPPRARDRVKDVFNRLMAGELKPFEYYESAVMARSGDERHIAWHNAVVRDDEGHIIGTFSSGEDITERKAVLAALHASEQRYRLLVDNVQFPVSVTSLATGRILFANSRAIEFFGLGDEPLANLDSADWWEDASARRELVGELRAQGGVTGREVVLRNRRGDRLWVELSARRIEFDGEDAAFAIFSDLSERKKAEDALRARERELELFFTQSLDGFSFLMLDAPIAWPAGAEQDAVLDYVFGYERITRANDALLAQYGATREQMIGATPARLMAHDLSTGRTIWRRLLNAGRLHIEIDGRRFDGTPIWIEADFICLYDGAGRITGHFGAQRDITQRKITERELHRSQVRLAKTMALGRMGGWEFDRAADEFVCSDALFALYGTNVAREGGYRFTAATYLREFADAEDAGRFATEIEKIRRAPRAGIEWDVETRFRRRDGEIRHVLVRITIVGDTDGRVVGARGVNTDITERVRAETERRKLSRALEQSPITVVITDRSGAIEYANPQFSKVSGYSLEEVRGKNPRVLKSGLQPESVYRELWANISSGREWHGELCNQHKDGTHFWEDVSISPVFAETGQITHYLAIKEDITERRKTMALLEERAALLEAARDAIIVINLEGRVGFWNHGAELIYGWTAAEAMNQVFEALVHDGEHPAPAELRRVILERGEWSSEVKQRKRSGETVLARMHGVLMRDPGGAPQRILLTSSDITEAKRIETLYLRAQRLESVGSLASGVAHDLNNVLSPIMMSVELLRPLAVAPEDREVINLLSDSVRRGADVVRQLLLFGRGAEAPSEAMDVGHVLNELLRMMRETFPRNLTIIGEVPSDLWPIRGYPTQVYQVLLNLCVNARDAMPTGGRLTVSARNLQLDDNFARLNPGARSGSHIELAVLDTGSGIPAEIIDRIFDPFFSTKEQGHGSGLGLSTVIGIVKSLDGVVTVASRAGMGSEFRIYLPAGEQGTAAECGGPADAAGPGRGELVLLVDDEVSIRHIVGRLLSSYGYRVLLAANGTEALHLAGIHSADLKVVVLDMMMPGLDGPEIVQGLRELLPALPIIACSGLERYRGELDTLGLEQIRFLRKPFTPGQLREELRDVLGDAPAV